MNFKQFLLEQEEDPLKLLAKKIKKDCSKFLNLKQELWRGIKVNNSKSLTKIIDNIAYKGTVRNNRSPKDSAAWFHEALDDYLYDKFKIKFRSNSLFCYTQRGPSRVYGEPYAVFPIGDFNYIYSDIISDPTEEFFNTHDMIPTLPKYGGGQSEKDYFQIMTELAKEDAFANKNAKENILKCKDYDELMSYLKTDISPTSKYYISQTPFTLKSIEFRKKMLDKFFKLHPDLYKLNAEFKENSAYTELMLNCKQFYAVNEDDYKKLMRFINEI